jgi:hypothetical protein
MLTASLPEHGSKAWTLYSRQERRLNIFQLHCIRRLLGLFWTSPGRTKSPTSTSLWRGDMPSMFTILTQRRVRWLCHVTRKEDDRPPKTFCLGSRLTERHPLGYKDACKCTPGPGVSRHQQFWLADHHQGCYLRSKQRRRLREKCDPASSRGRCQTQTNLHVQWPQ